MSDAFINISYSHFYVRVYVVFFVAASAPNRLDCCFLGFFSIFIILSAGKFTGIDFVGIFASVLVTAMELTGGGERWGRRQNSCCEYHSTLFIFRNQCFRMIHFFCCFIRKRGWERRRRTQFMFLTVKEISFLPMHTPRSSFYILQYFPSQ